MGNKPKSKLTELCINTWRRHLPDYKIIEWNDKNLNIKELCKKNKFLNKCYNLKLWAFVSDYLRLYILYNYGGIYFDTDIEVIKPFDDLLINKMFIGYEADEYFCTGVIGSESKNLAIKRILDFYENEIWTVNFINNPIIFKYLFINESELFKDCVILPREVFSPYSPGIDLAKRIESDNTYAIHWYTANWNLSRKGYVFIYTKHLRGVKKRYQKLKKTLGYIKIIIKKKGKL